jgi:hypothetical protein
LVLHQLLHLVPWWQTRKKMQDSLQLDEGAALEVSPFSMGAASGGVFWLSDHLLAMADRVVSAAAHEDHAIADTPRSPATPSIAAARRLLDRPPWKCRHFRWTRLQGASLASLIISWRWPIEWCRPRLTKITPSPIRPARPRRLRSRRRDGFWTGRAGNVAIFDGRGFRGRPWHL